MALWVAAASLLVWAISQWPTVRIVLWPRDDVQVVAANPMKGAVVVNFGDYEVFVAHINLFMTRKGKADAQLFFANMSVAPGKILQVAGPREDFFDSGFFVQNVKGENWETFLGQVLDDRHCFQILLFAVNDPFFQTIVAVEPTTNRVAAQGYVEHRNLTAWTKRYTRTPGGSGVIRAGSTPECQKK